MLVYMEHNVLPVSFMLHLAFRLHTLYCTYLGHLQSQREKALIWINSANLICMHYIDNSIQLACFKGQTKKGHSPKDENRSGKVIEGVRGERKI
jgi:hypothetical protein